MNVSIKHLFLHLNISILFQGCINMKRFPILALTINMFITLIGRVSSGLYKEHVFLMLKKYYATHLNSKFLFLFIIITKARICWKVFILSSHSVSFLNWENRSSLNDWIFCLGRFIVNENYWKFISIEEVCPIIFHCAEGRDVQS